MLRKSLLVVLISASPLVHAGADFDNLESLAQSQFRGIAEDLGAALSYKALAPAEPLGITGFDIGVEVTATKLQSTEAWESASGDNLSYLPLPKLHAHKGLPFNIDVGAFVAMVPGSDIQLVGGELRYSFVSGNVAVPAVAVRVAHTRLLGVDELDFKSTSIEATVSKGFAMLTPYGGIGRVMSTSTPNVGSLQEEDVDLTRVFAGLNFNMGLANLAFEADKTGDAATFGAKLGFRF